MKFNKKLIFFMITFLTPSLLILIMGVSKANTVRDILSGACMLLPTIGVIVGNLINKDKYVTKKIYLIYLIYLVTFGILLILLTFSNKENSETMSAIFNSVIVLASALFFLANTTEFNSEAKWDKCVVYILIYVVLWVLSKILIQPNMENAILVLKRLPLVIISPIYILPIFLLCVGEEYGWRFFLQPLLQKRFGKKMGVLILGIIWGIWHFPQDSIDGNMYLTYYLLLKIIFCVCFSIYMGWVFMKTNNVYIVAFIHGLNNFLSQSLAMTGKGTSFSINVTVILTMVVYIVLFTPFLFTREYSEVTINNKI